MRLRIVLVEPEHDGNVGSITRIMKNFDFNDLWLVNPKAPIGDEAKAYASHAVDILSAASTVSTLDEAIEGASIVAGTTSIKPKRSANVLRTAITPEEFSRISSSSVGIAALIFGRESRGLSNAELDKCDLVVTIPASNRYRALNVASAAAIILYELWKSKHGYSRIYFQEADRASRLRLVKIFDSMCDRALLPTYKRRLAARAFLNILSRAPASDREISLLLGALRQSLQRMSGEF
jgi:TrmH family RNA methyltransferase